MTRKLNKKGIIAILVLAFILLSILITSIMTVVYFSKLKPTSKESTLVEFKIEEGDTYTSIAEKLEENNLIKSKTAYKIYLKTHKIGNLKIGKFTLNKNMGVKKIINTLSGNEYKEDYIEITFKEGINIKNIASLISTKTNITEEEIFNTLKDEQYINSLIDEYWFLTDEIKNSEIYYPLEGYLFPNTYQFRTDSNIKDIFKVLLDQMDIELSKYKTQINNSNLSIHKLLTLASIVELEAGTSHERNGVAAVFYNRINNNWTLGSDVTTYYAEQKSFKEDLLATEIEKCNAYNTRSNCFTGLPVGPIANPSSESIDGVMNPTTSNYYYFVADKNGKTYFNTTENEHIATINELKRDGLWYIYE
ncbi:MAG: endolytic transglycosylase MltG [Bacilli bacterium]|nr:endolytic transglycosylase MltG [Bacilli bacterium]MBP3921311.1 endolytic transglycosylase MltG [Bacilli bacterium]